MTHTPPVSSIVASYRSHQIAPVSSIAVPCQLHRADQAKIDSNATRSRLHRTTLSSYPPRDLAFRSNPVASLSSFFSQFDRIWWIFFFWFCFFCVYLLRNDIIYLFGSWENWATSRKCVFYRIFKNITKHEKIFFKIFFKIPPNTWKYFLFWKIFSLENILRLENILHRTRHSLTFFLAKE